MQALIQKLHISQQLVGEIGITWEVNDPSQDFLFFVERSNSPEGPFETLNNIAINNAYGYIDRNMNTESVYRQVYYRIKAITNNETIYSQISKLDNEIPNYIGLSIARNKRLLLERFVGTKCLVFIRKTFGRKCSNCFDAIRHKSISSYCEKCYGTTYDGGFFSPIIIYVQTNPIVKAESKNELQYAENLRIEGFWSGNYPILNPGDLLVEVENPDIRYMIDQPMQRTEQHNALIEQRFPVTIIHRSRIEMKVPIPKISFSINDVNVFRKDYI